MRWLCVVLPGDREGYLLSDVHYIELVLTISHWNSQMRSIIQTDVRTKIQVLCSKSWLLRFLIAF
jgi:hypothetical protein